MTILVEALELILIVPLEVSNRHLLAGDTLHLNINMFDNSIHLNLEINIDKDTTMQNDILIIYNGQHPNDVLKAKAALLGYETCSNHKINDIPVIACINKMF